jgi:hypothetical protein
MIERFIIAIISSLLVLFIIYIFVPPLRPVIRALGRGVRKLLHWIVKETARLAFGAIRWLFRQLCGAISRRIRRLFRGRNRKNP